MDKITKAANPEPEDLNGLFADNKCVVNNDMVEFQDHVKCLRNCCVNYDMRISTTKAEVMSVGTITGNLSNSIDTKHLRQTAE